MVGVFAVVVVVLVWDWTLTEELWIIPLPEWDAGFLRMSLKVPRGYRLTVVENTFPHRRFGSLLDFPLLDRLESTDRLTLAGFPPPLRL